VVGNVHPTAAPCAVVGNVHPTLVAPRRVGTAHHEISEPPTFSTPITTPTGSKAHTPTQAEKDSTASRYIHSAGKATNIFPYNQAVQRSESYFQKVSDMIMAVDSCKQDYAVPLFFKPAMGRAAFNLKPCRAVPRSAAAIRQLAGTFGYDKLILWY
jgi:hypothetical protein